MPWSDYPLRSLTLPQDAGSGDSRIVIGPEIPAELSAYYASLPGAFTVVAAILFYDTAGAYRYIALLDPAQVVTGWQNLGDIIETFAEEAGVYGSSPNDVMYGLDPQALVDVFYGAPTPNIPTGACGVRHFISGGGATKLITTNKDSRVGTPAVLTSTNSAAYVNAPALASFNFNKQYDSPDSELLVRMCGTFYTSVNTTGAEFAVLVNGVDTMISRVSAVLTANSHTAHVGEREIAGLAAGTYSIQPRWRRSGAANNINMDASDDIMVTVEEIPT